MFSLSSYIVVGIVWPFSYLIHVILYRIDLYPLLREETESERSKQWNLVILVSRTAIRLLFSNPFMHFCSRQKWRTHYWKCLERGSLRNYQKLSDFPFLLTFKGIDGVIYHDCLQGLWVSKPSDFSPDVSLINEALVQVSLIFRLAHKVLWRPWNKPEWELYGPFVSC